MLTFLVFFPVIGAIAIATLPARQEAQSKYMALAVTGIVLIVSLVVFAMFDRNQDGLQFPASQLRVCRFDMLLCVECIAKEKAAIYAHQTVCRSSQARLSHY